MIHLNRLPLAGLLLLSLAPFAGARPPALLEAAIGRVREAVAQGEHTVELEEAGRELQLLAPGLPRASGEVVRDAGRRAASGDGAGALERLSDMPEHPPVTVQILGAARRVTGSCHLLRTPEANVMVDFGMAQGDREAEGINWRRFSFDPGELDALAVTHAHIDHIGLIPRLVKLGYKGPILTTPATAALMKISLEDSAKIQWIDASKKVGLRGRWFEGRGAAKPHEREKIEKEMLYTHADVAASLEQIRTVPYDEAFTEIPGVRLKFHDAGHLPGSAAVEAVAEADGESYTVIFGGDTGNIPYPLLRRPSKLPGADLILLESTYGAKVREAGNLEERYQRFVETVTEARSDGGSILMPAFAVGRSQVIISWLARMKTEGKLPRDQPILLDSPMASKTLEAMRQHPDALDENQIGHLRGKGGKFFDVPGLILGLKRGKKPPKGCIIIASSGMLTAGRSVGHAIALAGDPETDLIFTGHAAPGSPARRIMEGTKKITLGHGRRRAEVQIRAKIHRLSGFSGHADQKMLMDYIRVMESPPNRVVLVHGEPKHGEALKEIVESELGIPASFPARGHVFDLAAERRR